MLSRTREKLTALIASIAVLFAALGSVTFGPASASADMLVAATICSVDGVGHAPPTAPNSPAVPHHEHCAFCTSGVSVLAHAGISLVIALANPELVIISAHPELLPPDVVALQPLSPRAPPRFI